MRRIPRYQPSQIDLKMRTGWVILTLTFSIHQCTGDVINIALNKPASVSSTFTGGGLPAGGVVDGTITTVWPKIIHTLLGTSSAWWNVDLQLQVKHATVKIYFRTDFKGRRNGVQVYTSTTPFSTYPEGQLCHTVTGSPDGTDIPDVVSVNCSGSWRYLMVYTQTDNDGQGAVINFGEVEVLVCASGTYAHGCQHSCGDRKCIDPSSTCDLVTGQCIGGCKPGWNGTDCTQECNSGTYGTNCVISCSDRHCRSPSSSCDNVIGQCPDRCQEGWTGKDCVDYCPKGTFGIDCVSCSTRQCKGESDCPGDGTCSGECQDGWTLDNCTQVCSSGTYGPGCNSTCGNCKGTDICHHVTGSCPGDCQAGWQGQVCQQACQRGAYGVNCLKKCNNCNGTCDLVDGQCQEGCQEGYCGTQCQFIIQTTSSTVTAYAIGSVIGVVLMLLVNGGIFLCLNKHGRQKWVSTSRSEVSKQPTEMSDVPNPHNSNHGKSKGPQSSSAQSVSNNYEMFDIGTESDDDVVPDPVYENTQ